MILASPRTFRPLSVALLLAGLAAYPVSDARAACDLPVDDLCTNDAYYPDDGMEHASEHCVGTSHRQQTCNSAEGLSQLNVTTCPDGDSNASMRTSLKQLCAAMAQRNSCGIVDGVGADSRRMYATLGSNVGYARPSAGEPCETKRRASFLFNDRTQNGVRTIRVYNAYPQN